MWQRCITSSSERVPGMHHGCKRGTRVPERTSRYTGDRKDQPLMRGYMQGG